MRCGRHGSAISSIATGSGSAVAGRRRVRSRGGCRGRRRQHVGALEVEHQEHLRAPQADALDGDQLRDHLLVVELVQPLELELAGEHVLGERAQVARPSRVRAPRRRAALRARRRGSPAASAGDRRSARSAVRRSRGRPAPRAAGRRSCAPARRSGPRLVGRPSRGVAEQFADRGDQLRHDGVGARRCARQLGQARGFRQRTARLERHGLAVERVQRARERHRQAGEARRVADREAPRPRSCAAAARGRGTCRRRRCRTRPRTPGRRARTSSVVWLSTPGYSRPTWMWPCMIRQRSSAGSAYHARDFTNG